MNNFTNKVYLLTEHNETYQQQIDKLQLPDLEITDNPEDASILLASPPLVAKRLSDFPNVEWMQSVYAGVDALTTNTPNFLLTNVKGIFGQQIRNTFSVTLFNIIATFCTIKKVRIRPNGSPNPINL